MAGDSVVASRGAKASAEAADYVAIAYTVDAAAASALESASTRAAATVVSAACECYLA